MFELSWIFFFQLAEYSSQLTNSKIWFFFFCITIPVTPFNRSVTSSVCVDGESRNSLLIQEQMRMKHSAVCAGLSTSPPARVCQRIWSIQTEICSILPSPSFYFWFWENSCRRLEVLALLLWGKCLDLLRLWLGCWFGILLVFERLVAVCFPCKRGEESSRVEAAEKQYQISDVMISIHYVYVYINIFVCLYSI